LSTVEVIQKFALGSTQTVKDNCTTLVTMLILNNL